MRPNKGKNCKSFFVLLYVNVTMFPPTFTLSQASNQRHLMNRRRDKRVSDLHD